LQSHALAGRVAELGLTAPAPVKPTVPFTALAALVGFEDGIPPCLAVPERPVPDGTRAG
jgi:hypothetical protein